MHNSLDQTTSFLAKVEPETTGPKAITQKELNSLTLFWKSLEKKLKDAIVFKDFKSVTHSEEELAVVWEPFCSPKFERNFLIE
jgi:D-serine dehydratase